jgi:hypothetical protein
VGALSVAVVPGQGRNPLYLLFSKSRSHEGKPQTAMFELIQWISITLHQPDLLFFTACWSNEIVQRDLHNWPIGSFWRSGSKT